MDQHVSLWKFEGTVFGAEAMGVRDTDKAGDHHDGSLWFGVKGRCIQLLRCHSM